MPFELFSCFPRRLSLRLIHRRQKSRHKSEPGTTTNPTTTTTRKNKEANNTRTPTTTATNTTTTAISCSTAVANSKVPIGLTKMESEKMKRTNSSSARADGSSGSGADVVGLQRSATSANRSNSSLSRLNSKSKDYASRHAKICERYGVDPKKFNTPQPERRSRFIHPTGAGSVDEDTESDDVHLKHFLTRPAAGRMRRSISLDPQQHQQALSANPFLRMRLGASERGENLAQIEDASERMRDTSSAFSQIARRIAEKEKNKRWYQW